MKIKEVERRTDLTAANIRYYEKEGLIYPQRNEENNYREYSEEDVHRLKEIKKLRLLGITIQDIKSLFGENVLLSDLLKKRLDSIAQEQRDLELVENVCQEALKKNVELDTLDELSIDENSRQWQRQLAVILVEDTTKEIISREQLNKHVTIMLIYGYALAAIVSSLPPLLAFLSKGLENDDGVFFLGGIVVLVMTAIFATFTANMKIQLVIFHISVVVQSVVLMYIQLIPHASPHVVSFSFLSIAVYVFLLSILYKRGGKVLQKMRYSLGCWLVFEGGYMAVLLMTQRDQLIKIVMGIIFSLISFFITSEWTFLNKDQSTYNRYEAVIFSARMMNMVAFIFGKRGEYGMFNLRR